MKFDVKNIISKLQDFAAFHPEIIAIYLFGSLLTRKNAEDIDIALLFDTVPEDDKDQYRYGYKVELINELMQLLKTNDVDLTFLNTAPPPVAMNILRTGQRIVCTNDRVVEKHEYRIRQKYIDTKPLRDIKAYYLKKAYGPHD